MEMNMRNFFKNMAYTLGKIYQGLAIFLQTLSWATIKSWKLVSKAISYGNDFATATREIHQQVEKGRNDKCKEKNYTRPEPQKAEPITQEPEILYNRN